MSHVDVSGVSFALPDGRPLLDEVSFRVGEGSVAALIGPNGAGKTTLLKIVSEEVAPHGGAVTRSGALAVMGQFIGAIRDDRTVRDLLLRVAPPRVRHAGEALDAAEERIVTVDDEPAQLAYAQALVNWGDAGGYEQETTWDVVTTAALGASFDRTQWRRVSTLSGGEQKRLVLEALLRGGEEVLLLDEPDNCLDVPAKQWLEEQLRSTVKTVLLVSHDRELLNRAATHVITLEPSAAGATAWTHAGAFAGWRQARQDRNARLAERLTRWEEERGKLKALVAMYKQKAAYNSDMATRLQAAETRLRRFEEAGPPEKVAREQRVTMRLSGGRTAKRAVICAELGLSIPPQGTPTGSTPETAALMRPFDLEIWYGERVAVLGSNGSGKSHFLRLLASGGSDPAPGQTPVGDVVPPAVKHTGTARLGARVRPGWFAQTHDHEAYLGRTLLDILHRGDAHRPGRARDEAARVLDRYELARAAEQTFETLSGGQQARFQILILELSGATLLLLDEPTDNLDLHSAEVLQEALATFAGTVVAVTHDRWFARGFDRFLVFGADGAVYESAEPVWDEARVRRP